MTKSNMEYYFEFPASRGLQGNTLILLMNVPGRTLSRVLSSDNYGHTLERSQREINKPRVKKFYDYLVAANENKEPFIIPPLVGNCASLVEFEEFGNTNVGVVRFPMDAEIKLFDGQHRAAGISMFCKEHDTTLHVPLMMTLQLPLKTRQQFFSDINNNVSKPSAAINMAYNGRDHLAQGMVSFLSTHALFSEITDFEHNVVPAKSDLWISFKAINDATAKFYSDGENSLPDGDIYDIWEAWLNLTAIEGIRHGVSQAEYKRDYIQFHAVMINAFGYAIQELLRHHPVHAITLMIEQLVSNATMSELEDFFLISSWSGVCANTEKERATVISNVPAQKAAARRLVKAITTKTFTLESVTGEGG
ncbi:DGQHR domain-containing protein [Enterobacter kobei]|uniref:DGQHR domain-containing protein n=1 Tax=Enterobacter cloacae complex TaxID=354276 RepID=UPI002468FA9E|nr:MULTISPECIES: DGQHR domain-containing protein [Enterobacter cloacae complex]EKV4056804.1 DGQHR domain-containing protein [Enterobacter hormaechei]ELC6519405.1 DGQHR domain-containing protein [Enterobacter hormaechei]MDH5118749.1 DGQHR domain-containing protein [Enterobacter kobei]HEG1927346.1 DGQHR domain-containing protein [Enterobacter kobei]